MREFDKVWESLRKFVRKWDSKRKYEKVWESMSKYHYSVKLLVKLKIWAVRGCKTSHNWLNLRHPQTAFDKILFFSFEKNQRKVEIHLFKQTSLVGCKRMCIRRREFFVFFFFCIFYKFVHISQRRRQGRALPLLNGLKASFIEYMFGLWGNLNKALHYLVIESNHKDIVRNRVR